VDIDQILRGELRPPNIPPDWQGRPTRGRAGVVWSDPRDPGNSVRFYPGEAGAGPYVVVTRGGLLLDRDGAPIPGSCAPED